MALVFCALVHLPSGAQQNSTDNASAIDSRTSLELSLGSLRERLRVAQDAATPERAAQLGVPVEDLQRKGAILQEHVYVLERQLESVQSKARFEEQKQAAERDLEAFTGFPEPPPYTVAFLDGQLAALATKEYEIETATQQIQYSRDSVDRYKKRLAEAQGRAATIQAAIRSGTGTARDDWEAGLVQSQIELEQANINLAQATSDAYSAKLEALNAERAFSQKKVELARSNTVFNQKQLDEKLASLAEKRTAAEKKVEDAATARDREERLAKEAQTRLDEARASGQAEADLKSLIDEVGVLRITADNAARVYEIRLGLARTFSQEEQLWRIREKLLSRAEGAPSRETRQQVSAMDEEVAQDRQMFIAGMTGVRSALMGLPTGAESDAFAKQKQASYTTLLETYAEALVRVFEVQQLVARLREELDSRLNTATFAERYKSIKEDVVTWWNYPLTNVEDNPLTLGKIIIALLIFIAGMVVVHFLTRWIRRLLIERMHVEEGAAIGISKGFYYLLIVIVVYYALFVVQIPLTVFTFLGGALAIGVGFGAQNLINNFISGLILLVERPIKIHDIVDVDGHNGRIVNVGARCSQMRTFTGVDVLIPNSHFLEKNVVNWTHSDTRVRFSISIGVEYGSPTRDVGQLIMDAVKEHGRIQEDPAPVVLFRDFGDNALIFEAFFWVDLATGVDPRVVQSDLRHRISYMLSEANIGIPFPQSSVHLSTEKPLRVEVVSPVAEADSNPAKDE
ncbi:MAG: hypothetical protein AMXMBFR84_04330 [Candidatus Hydrogenedentota bacterium]